MKSAFGAFALTFATAEALQQYDTRNYGPVQAGYYGPVQAGYGAPAGPYAPAAPKGYAAAPAGYAAGGSYARKHKIKYVPAKEVYVPTFATCNGKRSGGGEFHVMMSQHPKYPIRLMG